MKVAYYETSAKSADGIDNAFMSIVDEIIRKDSIIYEENIILQEPKTTSAESSLVVKFKKNCCF
jgi:hypothetical protein